MPAKYDAIKKACMERGGSEDECQALAARIYNAQRKPGETPMGPDYEARAAADAAKKRK